MCKTRVARRDSKNALCTSVITCIKASSIIMSGGYLESNIINYDQGISVVVTIKVVAE